ncbi:MAG: acyltransferase [Clostridiales bacterium]|nr:acyltransferase [Clostridiales bacterium]
MNLLKIVKKAWKVLSRTAIKQLAHFDGTSYTKAYTKHLRKYGMDIEGLPRYIATTATFDGNDYSIIHLGEGCVISSDVQLLTHDYSIARGLQAIGKNNPEPYKDELFLKGISIGKNSFIGARTLLMPGTTIGDNCIIGAGSIVKGTVKDDSIVFGNPAKFYCKTSEWAEKNIKSTNTLLRNKNAIIQIFKE